MWASVYVSDREVRAKQHAMRKIDTPRHTDSYKLMQHATIQYLQNRPFALVARPNMKNSPVATLAAKSPCGNLRFGTALAIKGDSRKQQRKELLEDTTENRRVRNGE